MRNTPGKPDQWTARMLRRLLPGARGGEICEDLEKEYHRVHKKYHRRIALLWYIGQLARPSTWMLALELRSLQRKKRMEAVPPAAKKLAGPSWLDLKLGLRMLVKSPGVTLVALFGLAIGIPVGLLPIHVIDSLHAPLPFDGGESIVGLQHWDVTTSSPVPFGSMLHDVVAARGELSSFEEIGVVVPANRNFRSADGMGAPVYSAAVTASVFDLLRVQPLMGRALTGSDEDEGAADVVVIGHDVWQSRLAGDPNVVGSTVYLGRVPHTVVGVMPAGFLFPVNHGLWLPLRLNPNDYMLGQGPEGLTYGRLAEGISVENAQAELTTLGARMAAEFPGTYGHLRPRIVPHGQVTGLDLGPNEALILSLAQLFTVLLLAAICGNVGMLILARTTSRMKEIAVRTALGASRTRIVAQLFLESLILALLATGIGLVVGDRIASHFDPWEVRPFWFDLGVNGRTVAFAVALGVFSAVIAGVIPALKATGSGMESGLRQVGGGGGGIRFGRASSALIVGDVTLAVLLLFVATDAAHTLGLRAPPDGWMGIRPEEFVAADLRFHYDSPTGVEAGGFREEWKARTAEVQRALVARLGREPSVRSVAVARELPGTYHAPRRIEWQGEGSGAEAGGHWVRHAIVDLEFFKGLGQPVLRGRSFLPSDLEEGTLGVIVNETFVTQVLGGTNPIGQRIRHVSRPDSEPGPWYEIVGTVGHLGMNPSEPFDDPGIYRPARAGTYEPRLAVRVSGDGRAFIPRLRQIAQEIDPSIMIRDPGPFPDLIAKARWLANLQMGLVGSLGLISVLFAAVGLYALMSFLVSQRTREIGIRTALGAAPRQILWSVGRRALIQLTVGIVAGFALALLLSLVFFPSESGAGFEPWKAAALISLGVVSVGILACVQPTLRGLGIQPTEALREGG